MEQVKRTVAAALGGALYLAAIAGPSIAGDWSDITMTHLQAKNFDVGAKHIVSFYLKADGVCRLTLMIAESTSEDAASAQTSRLQLVVVPGKSARFDTAQGKSLSFACEQNALAMIVRRIDRVADYPAGE